MRLVVEGLACERGGRTLFDKLSFTVEQGQGLVVTGPNGIGKTSLLRILAGLLRPSDGQVRLENGRDGTDLDDMDLTKQVHFVGAKDAVKPSLTAREHIRHWTDLLGGHPMLLGQSDAAPELRRNARETVLLAEMLLLPQADLPAVYLSAGQRRKLALARLFTAVRTIWLLDEPFNALDAAARDMFSLRLTRFMASGGILVLATHDAVALRHTRQIKLGRNMLGIVPEPLA